MDNLFNAQLCFNGGNPNFFKVGDGVTLKDLKDQLNEINQGLNPEDTKRVEDDQCERLMRLHFNEIILTNDDCVRSMFSVFRHHNMFPMIEMDATLLGSSEDILKSLILPYD